MKIFSLITALLLYFGPLSLEASSAGKSFRKYQAFILKAETRAAPAARKVMQTIRHMVERGVVIRGACWDYLDAAFTKAGYPRGKRRIVFKGRKNGRHVSPKKIQVGDWLYYINHSYHNVEHSGMFIGWTNSKKHLGLMMSYAGEGRAEPARYKIYDLSDVYHIMRAE